MILYLFKIFKYQKLGEKYGIQDLTPNFEYLNY